MQRLLLGGLLTALALPVSADELFDGFGQLALPGPPLSIVARTLADGSTLLADGGSIDLYDPSGDHLLHVGALPPGAELGAFRVSPNESFALVGDRTSGALYRMELDGSGQVLVADLPGNTDAAFEANNRVLVSAATAVAGPGYELWRVRISPPAANLILEIPGDPGPVGLAGDGSAFLGTRSKAGQPGSSELLRVEAGDLQNVDLSTWEDTGGMLALEIEFVPPAGDWVAETTHAGFTGESYYRWNGPDHFNDPGNGVLTFPFHVNQDGLYRLRIHNRHEHPDSTLENDCWVRMDGDEWVKVFSGGGGSVSNWNWATTFDPESGPHGPAQYQLEAGAHELEISGRSKNFMIDRLHLYLDGTPGGTDESTPTSFVYAPGREMTTTLAGGFDGADSIAVDEAYDTVFLAETSEITGAQRIHAIGDVLPFHPVLVDTLGDGALANVEFLPGYGDGFFYPFQPPQSGRLIYQHEALLGGFGNRYLMHPARPQIELTGPGTGGAGPFQLRLEGGWPDGHVLLFFGLASAASPTESVFPLPSGLPLVHSPLDPDEVYVIPAPLPLDAEGELVLDLENPVGVPGVVVFQCLLLDQGLNVIGSSAAAVL